MRKNVFEVEEIIRRVVEEAIACDAWIKSRIMSVGCRSINQVSDLGKVVDIDELLDIKNHVEDLFIDVLEANEIASVGCLRDGLSFN